MTSDSWPTSAVQRWFFRRLPADRGEIRLHRKRIYVLPTRHGYLFAVVVALIVLGAMNYGASLGYFTAFLLVGIGLVSMLHAFRNLHGLQITISPGAPVFAGHQAHFTARINNRHVREHYMISFEADGVDAMLPALPPNSWSTAELPLAAPARGRLACGAVKVSSVFPLGLVICWSWLKPSGFCTVYPTPLSDGQPLPHSTLRDGTGHSRTNDNEDFYGFRDYRVGDPLRHIAWRTLARGQPLQTKEFVGESGGDLWLSWEDAHYADPELRLQQLCAWVLEADALSLRYGLRLPNASLPPASGDTHRHACLELLAMY
ncbi:MAG: DUF58 domain-containing protein [Gammaproteobacteria bacterium]|nr:DUF58 domain-containing protein [Gammaproteobacteria bacterium]